jgi:hypothetical protein
MSDLKELMQLINEYYQFNSSTHENLKNVEHVGETPKHYENYQFIFGIEHSLMHMMKTEGKLATLVEKFHHASFDIEEVPQEEIQELVVKQVVNALKLASHMGLSAENIIADIKKQSEFGYSKGLIDQITKLWKSKPQDVLKVILEEIILYSPSLISSKEKKTCERHWGHFKKN